jgi:hypothetical protein
MSDGMDFFLYSIDILIEILDESEYDRKEGYADQ